MHTNLKFPLSLREKMSKIPSHHRSSFSPSGTVEQSGRAFRKVLCSVPYSEEFPSSSLCLCELWLVEKPWHFCFRLLRVKSSRNGLLRSPVELDWCWARTRKFEFSLVENSSSWKDSSRLWSTHLSVHGHPKGGRKFSSSRRTREGLAAYGNDGKKPCQISSQPILIVVPESERKVRMGGSVRVFVWVRPPVENSRKRSLSLFRAQRSRLHGEWWEMTSAKPMSLHPSKQAAGSTVRMESVREPKISEWETGRWMQFSHCCPTTWSV